jgi:putative SOS response-associated peptidase YedK
MPAILTDDDLDIWMNSSEDDALRLARPFDSARMQNILTGPREDDGTLSGDLSGAAQGSLL